ncbi:MAG: YdcF family protein [Anaeromicrobium sp.]|uniref:YdcF family protein n=1 Tax=Anaeromicrobium sp. TaxID=1929132 RepID=UPI0025CE03DE|nr:YdcF family protein [Anaeromicrobium sp.]MCT4593442.1 YdcF family protein [Anaeromicrobium sp.]
MKRKIISLFKILGVLWFLSFILIEGLILINGVSKEYKEVDYVVVLGAGLKWDKLSVTLRERLDKSYEYLEKNKHIQVVVSGGQGPDEATSEALAMEKYLINKGISKDRIIKEDKSTSTYENLKNTYDILRKKQKKEKIRLGIVTNRFHQFRAGLLAKEIGFESYSIVSKTKIYQIPKYYIREYFAIIKSLLYDI